MSDETLLAHLAHRLGRGSEDLATEALAFILQNPAAARGMEAHARRWSSGLDVPNCFRTQDWLASDEAIPDLVAVAPDGSTPLIVEAKFGAALTPNQPVTYLRRLLLLDTPTLLLFLVPGRRATPIWAELRRRCSDAGIQLTTADPLAKGSIKNVVVAVTTWADLLLDIEHNLTPPTDHHRTRAELEQLQGLCELQDRTLFQPLSTDFLGGGTGRRLMDLDALLNEAIETLVAAGLASIKGLTRAAGTGYYGRYVQLAGWTCLLQVNFTRWGTQRHTPLWLQITDPRAYANQALRDALAPLTSEQPPRLLDEDGKRQIPIFLPHDVDRDAVFAAVDRQLQEVRGLLSQCPPITAPPENVE